MTEVQQNLHSSDCVEPSTGPEGITVEMEAPYAAHLVRLTILDKGPNQIICLPNDDFLGLLEENDNCFLSLYDSAWQQRATSENSPVDVMCLTCIGYHPTEQKIYVACLNGDKTHIYGINSANLSLESKYKVNGSHHMYGMAMLNDGNIALCGTKITSPKTVAGASTWRELKARTNDKKDPDLFALLSHMGAAEWGIYTPKFKEVLNESGKHIRFTSSNGNAYETIRVDRNDRFIALKLMATRANTWTNEVELFSKEGQLLMSFGDNLGSIQSVLPAPNPQDILIAHDKCVSVFNEETKQIVPLIEDMSYPIQCLTTKLDLLIVGLEDKALFMYQLTS